MTQLVYSNDELMAESPHAREQFIAGDKMHGGFDAAGKYVSPRTLHRWPAVRAWQEALEASGGELIDATTELLSKDNYPNHAQQKFLLKEGLGQVFWNGLTITGIFEGRGRFICEATLPNFQDIIVEDISEMAIGHAHTGLLYAHGADEGGDPQNKGDVIGGHDAMWYALRDLAFGKDAYPLVEPGDTLARPGADEPLFPKIPEAHAGLLGLLLNLLMIEIRAESFFTHCFELLGDPALFTDRRAEADEANDIVQRIRDDELIHVVGLRVMLSEMRQLTFKTKDGGTMSGAELIDGPFATMVDWHTNLRQEGDRERTQAELHALIRTLDNGEGLVKEFDALEFETV